MLMLIQNQSNLRQTSPVKGPQVPAPSKPELPADKIELGQANDKTSSLPSWASAAFAGLGLLAGATGVAQAQQAQVVVDPQSQQVTDVMQQLDEASLKQGVGLEFMIPSPIGGGRTISHQDAGQMLSQGQRVLLAEVTSSSGPFRGGEPTLVRRETYLTGQQDLESYARYFTNAEPHSDRERAAQNLKKFVYGQTELTLLQRPGQSPTRPSLSPFAAASRLEQQLPVKVLSQGDGITRKDAKEFQLNGLTDVAELFPHCMLVEDFKMQPDGTIHLIEKSYCEGGF